MVDGRGISEYSYVKRALLRELSENSRTPVTTLAKRLKCSRNTVINNIKAVEREFSLFYTIEFTNDKIDTVQSRLWSVKLGIKPDKEDLKRMLQNYKPIRFAAATEGDFDLVMRIISESDEDYAHFAMKLSRQLLAYKPTIKPSNIILPHFGFMPISNDIIERLDLSDAGLDKLDKGIIMLLNENSRISLASMAKRLNCSMETIRYRFRKLQKSGLIRRFTIVMRKPKMSYGIAFFINFEFGSGAMSTHKEAYDFHLNVDEKLPLQNKFQYLATLSGSDMIFGMGQFESKQDALKDAIVAHKDIYQENNPSIPFARITEVIKGEMPVRNLDIKKEYKPIDFSRIRDELH